MSPRPHCRARHCSLSNHTQSPHSLLAPRHRLTSLITHARANLSALPYKRHWDSVSVEPCELDYVVHKRPEETMWVNSQRPSTRARESKTVPLTPNLEIGHMMECSSEDGYKVSATFQFTKPGQRLSELIPYDEWRELAQGVTDIELHLSSTFSSLDPYNPSSRWRLFQDKKAGVRLMLSSTGFNHACSAVVTKPPEHKPQANHETTGQFFRPYYPLSPFSKERACFQLTDQLQIHIAPEDEYARDITVIRQARVDLSDSVTGKAITLPEWRRQHPNLTSLNLVKLVDWHSWNPYITFHYFKVYEDVAAGVRVGFTSSGDRQSLGINTVSC